MCVCAPRCACLFVCVYALCRCVCVPRCVCVCALCRCVCVSRCVRMQVCRCVYLDVCRCMYMYMHDSIVFSISYMSSYTARV